MNLLKKIWSHPDCVLVIFAGSSAEFALNPASDWLFFTGRLPADPIARFASTITYSHQVIFAPSDSKQLALAKNIHQIHTKVEDKRGLTISAVAYRDVLLMITAYTLSAYPLVFNEELTDLQKDSIVKGMGAVWQGMNIVDPPENFQEFDNLREEMMTRLAWTEWTGPLLESYEKSLGKQGYYFLILTYREILDGRLLSLLKLKPSTQSWFLKPFFHFISKTRLITLFYQALFPVELQKMLALIDKNNRERSNDERITAS